MFDVGFAEIFLLALIGLLVLGPERLPGVARTVGGFVRKARMSWVSLRNTIESEIAQADLTDPIKQASEEFQQIGKELKDTAAFDPEGKKPDPVTPDPVSEESTGPEAQTETKTEKQEDVRD